MLCGDLLGDHAPIRPAGEFPRGRNSGRPEGRRLGLDASGPSGLGFESRHRNCWMPSCSPLRGAAGGARAVHRARGGAMIAVGFELTQLSLVELESTPLDHSGKLSLRQTMFYIWPGPNPPPPPPPPKGRSRTGRDVVGRYQPLGNSVTFCLSPRLMSFRRGPYRVECAGFLTLYNYKIHACRCLPPVLQ